MKNFNEQATIDKFNKAIVSAGFDEFEVRQIFEVKENVFVINSFDENEDLFYIGVFFENEFEPLPRSEHVYQKDADQAFSALVEKLLNEYKTTETNNN